MNVVKCCCISYNQLFQTSFVATLFRTWNYSKSPKLSKYVQPCSSKGHTEISKTLPSQNLFQNLWSFTTGNPQTFTPQLKPATWRLPKDKLLSVISPGNRKSWTVFETWVATYGKRSTFWKNSSIFFGEASMYLLECSKVMHFVNFSLSGGHEIILKKGKSLKHLAIWW